MCVGGGVCVDGVCVCVCVGGGGYVCVWGGGDMCGWGEGGMCVCGGGGMCVWGGGVPGQESVNVFEELTLGARGVPHDAHVEVAS